MPLRTDSQKLAASSSSTTKKKPPAAWTRSRICPSRWVLPEPAGPRNDDAQRGGDGVAGGVAEGVHDVVGGVLVETLDVSLCLGPPQIVGGGSPGEAKRCERFPLCFVHQGSIAMRCLSCPPMVTAAS